ncbi:DUF4124 domain-containing protein [Pseudomonadota bacterium]|nr:DUF4124 domain-containing protein [Pseudomonadota bacterium]
MFTHYSRFSYLFFILLGFSHNLFADAYKWINENKSTHYSEQAPTNPDQDFELIKDPPPPAVDPAVAQKEVDILIEKLEVTYEEDKTNRDLAKQEQEKRAKLLEYCEKSKHNLSQYTNNPGRRSIDRNGNVTKQNEEQRQQKIAEIQHKIKEYCN